MKTKVYNFKNPFQVIVRKNNTDRMWIQLKNFKVVVWMDT